MVCEWPKLLDYEKFDNQIMEFAFPDHHAPPLNLYWNCVMALDEWLRNPNHIAAVHCLAGR